MKKSKIRDNRVGMKFYRYNANKELEVIRIKRVYSKDKVVVFNDNEPITHTRVMKLDQILNDWTSLVPDATISFNIVKDTKNNNDVMIYAVLVDDMKDGNILPYVVCRTNVVNPVSSGKLFGNTVCRENSIQGSDGYRNAITVKSYVKSCIVHMYMTDTPFRIIELIPNNNIHNLNATIAEFVKKYDASYFLPHSNFNHILNYTGFWTMLDYAWKIENLPIIINDSSIDILTKFIEDKRTSYIKDLEVINYDKDIDLTKLPSDYMLVRDLEGVIYLATFFKDSSRKYTENIDNCLKPNEIESILGK